MIDWVKNLVSDVQLNSTIAIFLYWIPVAIAMTNGILVTIKELTAENECRQIAIQRGNSFHPSLTVGDLVVRFIATFIPIVNVFITLSFIYERLKRFVKIFDIKLVKPYTPPRNQ